MSINIWGTGSTKETSKDVSTVINQFIKKSGDIMRGVLNMGGNRVVNIGDPVNNSDAVHKSYCDNTFLQRIVVNNVFKIGSNNDNFVEIIKNNEAYLTLGDNYINVNKKLFIGDSEAVNKRYFDNHAVLRGGERGMPDNLKVGTLDEKSLELISNNETYISFNNREINVNQKQISNLRDPINNDEAVHKGYVDKINEIISKNSQGIVFLKRDTDSYMNLNNNMINIEKDLNLNHGVRIRNIAMPISASDPVHKQYVDTRMVHIGGNESVIGGLKIGTTDNLPLYLIRNRETFIALDNSMIDCNNHRIINISDPVDDHNAVNKRYFDNNAVHKDGERGLTNNLKIGTLDDKYVEFIRNGAVYFLLNNDIDIHRTIDVNKKPIKNLRDPINDNEAVHKGYVDMKVLTKNHVGYIPLIPTHFGFVVQTTIRHIDQNVFSNIFNNNLTSMWEANLDRNPFFITICPNRVIVWKVVLILPDSNIPLNFQINIYGFNDHDNTWTSITSGISLQMFNGEIVTYTGIDFNRDDINTNQINKTKYQKYKIEFNRANEVPVRFRIIRFQMFVYND